MYYRIYLDTLFFVNLFMDYCILTLVSKILRYTTTHLFLRRVFGATFGALWLCVAIAFRIHNFWGDIISYILVPGVMNYILLGKCELRLYLKGIALLYAMAATLGGMLHWLYYYTVFGYLLNKATFGTWMLVFSVVLCMPAIVEMLGYIGRKTRLRETEKSVVIENDEQKVELRAFVDTGNSLQDPFFSGEPVNVVEYDKIKNVLGSEEKSTYHIIPFRSLGNEKGIIPVVRLKRLTIFGEKGSIHIEKPLVALYTGKLSGKGEYNMILHPEVVRDYNNRQGDGKNVFKSNDAKKISISDDSKF